MEHLRARNRLNATRKLLLLGSFNRLRVVVVGGGGGGGGRRPHGVFSMEIEYRHRKGEERRGEEAMHLLQGSSSSNSDGGRVGGQRRRVKEIKSFVQLV